jgi:hypothetical protein
MSKCLRFFTTGWLAAVLIVSFAVTEQPLRARADQNAPSNALVLLPLAVWSTSGDNLGNSQDSALSGNLRLGAAFTHRFSRKWSASVVHTYLDTTTGRIIVAGHDIDPGLAVDPIALGYATYTFNPRVSLDAGYFERQRSCCPGWSDPSLPGPFRYHDEYAQANIGLGKIAPIGPQFALQAQLAYVTHPVLAPGWGGNKFMAQGLARYTLFLEPHDLTGLSIGYHYASDYFESLPVITTYNMVFVDFTHAFSRHFIFQAEETNFTQHDQGVPFPAPNTIHWASLQLNGIIPIEF